MNKFNHLKIGIKTSVLSLLLLGIAVPSMTLSEEKASGGTKDAKDISAVKKRDPFWPIGFKPKGDATPAAAPEEEKRPAGSYDWPAAMKQVSISGVSSKGKDEFFAVVNGKLKSVGDTISVEYKGIVYTWAVDSIKPPGSVKLRRVSAL